MIYTSDAEIYEDETAHALGVKHPSTVDYADHLAANPPVNELPNISGGLSKPPKPANDNDPRKPFPPRAEEKTITIVRHGATHLNNDTNNSVDKIRGWSDVPLTDEGRDQAHKAGDQLKSATVDSIHTSDLSRAHETAKIIGSYVGVDPTPTDKLRPWDLGEFTGKSTKESLPKIQEYARDKPDEPVPGGESFNQFKARAFQGLSEAMQSSDNPLIVTHHRTERLLKAWDKAGQPTDFNIHIPTFLEKGEDTGKVEQMKVVNWGAPSRQEDTKFLDFLTKVPANMDFLKGVTPSKNIEYDKSIQDAAALMAYGMKRREQETANYRSAAPPAMRMFASTLLGDKSKITENHFSNDELDILRETVEKAEAKGRNYIGYGDYGKGDSFEKSFTSEGTKAFMHAMTDKRSSLAFTLGMANFKRNPDDSITIKDRYHWAAKKEMVDKHRDFLSAAKLMMEGLKNNGLLGVGNVIGNYMAPSEGGRDVEITIPPKERGLESLDVPRENSP